MKEVNKMSWKNTIRKTERDLTVGSTNYAKDLGDSVEFGGYTDASKNVTVPKDQLNDLLERYNNTIQRLTQITMKGGNTDNFVRWLRENM